MTSADNQHESTAADAVSEQAAEAGTGGSQETAAPGAPAEGAGAGAAGAGATDGDAGPTGAPTSDDDVVDAEIVDEDTDKK